MKNSLLFLPISKIVIEKQISGICTPNEQIKKSKYKKKNMQMQVFVKYENYLKIHVNSRK